jgi:ABC-type antimicrobial peptide transport system permease subunit
MRTLAAALGEARRALRARWRRAVLAAVGIALAATMLSAAIVIADGLGGGFDRAVRAANLGDLIVRFNAVPASEVEQRLKALPDLAGYALRTEVQQVGITYGAHHLPSAIAEVVDTGERRGYDVIAGHDIHGDAADVLVEPAFAKSWHIRIGATIEVAGLGPERVAGFAEGPDDVGYPLASARIYMTRAAVTARLGHRTGLAINFAEIWLRNPRYLNEVLVQARDESFGLRNLQFETRSAVRVLIDQAAGIVIDLLVALSAIALVTAGVMLFASARAEVQRRLRAIGVRRAVGASRGFVTLTHALEAAIVAVPAALLGTIAGWLATNSSGDRLLTLLNEPGPGGALILPLAGAWLLGVAIPVAGAAWPAWVAAGRPIVVLLRGADVARRRTLFRNRFRRPTSRRRKLRQSGGLTGLGARLVAARPTRLLTTVSMLAGSAAFVLLMIALASTLSSLETDPQELGKRYQLTASLPPSKAPRVARIAGVEAAAPRYEAHAVDGFDLGEFVDVIAYPGDHTRFEDPPLASGQRLRGQHQAEVGVGLANALGLAPGSDLLLELSSGHELQLRVSGTVSSLDDDGLVAYVPAGALLKADPSASSKIVVVLKPGANQADVSAALTRLGAAPSVAAGATARGGPLVAVLKTLLRAVAVVDGLVCLYALVQACALTVQERRRTVAVLRACGAGPAAVSRLLLGAVLALVVPAALIGIVLERALLGPVLSNLAAGYASLALAATLTEVLALIAGLALAAAFTVLWVTRAAMRERVLAGLAG